MLNRIRRHSCATLSVAALSLALATPAVASLQVTSVSGEAVADGDALVQHGEVAPGETIETVEDGKCSLLLSDDAVLQLCNRAAVSARPRAEGGANILDMLRGEMKATVAPRPADAPLEIHTPAAVATILGTVVHIAVDPETGDTLITSIESRIKVTGASGDDKAVVIDSGQQVVIEKGGDPSAPRELDRNVMSNLSECLNDSDYRYAAVAGERVAWMRSLLDTVTAMDAPVTGLAGVAAPSAVASLFGALGVSTDDLSQNVCFASQSACDHGLDSSLPVDTDELNDLIGIGGSSGCFGPGCNLSGAIDLPDACGGVPGDQCRP